MLHLAQHPEIFQPLPDEVVQLLRRHRWKKTSLYDTKLLGSVIRDSQRLKPSSIGEFCSFLPSLSKVESNTKRSTSPLHIIELRCVARSKTPSHFPLGSVRPRACVSLLTRAACGIQHCTRTPITDGSAGIDERSTPSPLDTGSAWLSRTLLGRQSS